MSGAGITLWGRPSSINVQKVLWTLDELGLGFDNRVVGGPHGGLDDPAFTAISPLPRVPVLDDGGTVVWESHAILRYLARREGALGEPLTDVDIWMEFGSTTLQPPFIGVFWQILRTPAAERSAEVETRHKAALRSALEVVEARLDGREHLAGEEFSLVDIAVGSLLYRIEELAPDVLEGLDAIAAWGARLKARPGYGKWIETSYEELRVRG